MKLQSKKTWLLTALLSVALAIAAVTVVASLSYTFSLGVLARVAEQIASPGEFLWWSTTGGAFAGKPTGLAGIALWVLGTATFWFLVASIALLSDAWLRQDRK